LALPLAGGKSGLTRKDFFDYFGRRRLGLTDNAVREVEETLVRSRPSWDELIDRSFLGPDLKSRYRDLVAQRWARLEFRRTDTVVRSSS
jgi:hypothetical protein